MAADVFLIRLAANAEMVARLRHAQDLLSHAVPRGDLTEIFDRAPDSPSVCTLTLVEQNGRTTMTLRSLFSSPGARTMACESGMESGVVQCMTQIDDILAALL